MPKKPKSSPAPATTSPVLVLDPVLDLKAAAPLAAALLERRNRDVTLDASAVQRLGAQCLQVLLAASATWDADGSAFRIDSIPPAIGATLTLLGVSPDDIRPLRVSPATTYHGSEQRA